MPSSNYNSKYVFLFSRAFGIQKSFIRHLEQLVDDHQRAYFTAIVASRWRAIQLETLGNVVVFSAAIFAVLGSYPFLN